MTCAMGKPTVALSKPGLSGEKELWHADGNPDAQGEYHYVRDKCLGPDCKPTDAEIVEALEKLPWTKIVRFASDGVWVVNKHVTIGKGSTFREAVTLAIKAERGRKT